MKKLCDSITTKTKQNTKLNIMGKLITTAIVKKKKKNVATLVLKDEEFFFSSSLRMVPLQDLFAISSHCKNMIQ